MPYNLRILQGDIAKVQHDQASVGTGRLIGQNLILTAGHLLRRENDLNELVLCDWDVWIFKERWVDGHWPHRPGGRVVWNGWAIGLDMALIALDPVKTVRPDLRLRIATVTESNPHAIEARGFPDASIDPDEAKVLTPAFGLLTGGDPLKPLRFGVDSPDIPNIPHTGWPGMSGSAVTLRDWPDPDTLWVYGVVEHVPTNFDRQFAVARLADAWRDPAFRKLLMDAGVEDIGVEDPTKRLLTQFPKRSVIQDVLELLRLLRTTRTTFDAQARVREELVDRLTVRLVLEPPYKRNAYEEIFAEHHAEMLPAERRRFDLIRSLTTNVLAKCNRRALEILEANKSIPTKGMSTEDLREHLRIWLTKFDAIFVSSPELCLLYVGPEEGVPFPMFVERELWNWVQEQPGGAEASLGDLPPPVPVFTESGGSEGGPDAHYKRMYLEYRWRAKRLDELHRGGQSAAYNKLYAAIFREPSFLRHPKDHDDALASLAEKAEECRQNMGTYIVLTQAEKPDWEPPQSPQERSGPREPARIRAKEDAESKKRMDAQSEARRRKRLAMTPEEKMEARRKNRERFKGLVNPRTGERIG